MSGADTRETGGPEVDAGAAMPGDGDEVTRKVDMAEVGQSGGEGNDGGKPEEGGDESSEVAGEAKAQAQAHSDAVRNLELILDIPLEVSVELGRRRMPIHELLKLNQGSVVELGKLAGEPLDILVNQKLIARGEAVVVNEKFGVRLTDIVSPTERIERITGDKEGGEWQV